MLALPCMYFSLLVCSLGLPSRCCTAHGYRRCREKWRTAHNRFAESKGILEILYGRLAATIDLFTGGHFHPRTGCELFTSCMDRPTSGTLRGKLLGHSINVLDRAHIHACTHNVSTNSQRSLRCWWPNRGILIEPESSSR